MKSSLNLASVPAPFRVIWGSLPISVLAVLSETNEGQGASSREPGWARQLNVMAAAWNRRVFRSYEWIRNQDLLVLILMLSVVLGWWGFFLLANGVQAGKTRGLDEAIILGLRQPGNPADPLGPPWVEGAARDVTALGSVAVLLLITAAVAGFVALRRQYHALGLLLAALGGGLMLNGLLKGWFERPRPELVSHLVRVESWSFPSGHSLLSAVVYLTLGALLARLVEPLRLKAYVICVGSVLTFLVGLSRVYLGVHYPTDVLAGWTVGLLWAVICWLVARALQNRGKVEEPR